jgi:hypothetical protein
MQYCKQCILGLLALLALCSCSEEITSIIGEKSQQPIQLSGQIDQENVTRANDYGFVGGDKMGIYIVDRVGGQAGQLGASDNRAQNVLFTYDDDNHRWSSPAAIYWRDEETGIDVYGYYPGVNYVESPTSYAFEVQADQSTEAQNGDLGGYEQSDLLWGKKTSEFTTSQIVLKYNHILAGVRVLLQKGDGITDTEWDKLKKIVLVENTVRKASVDLSTGATAVDGSDVSVVRMAPQSGDSYRAVVIPQTVAAGRQLLSITIDGKTYSHKLDKAMNYQGGKLHNFTMTVNKSADTGDYEVKVTDDGITPWTNDESSHQFTAMMYVTVHCPEIGKLKESIAAAGYDYKTIQNLKVTGELTEEDFQVLRAEMPELRHLNLKSVKVKHVRYYDGWLDHGSHDFDLYRDDMLPNNAFWGDDNNKRGIHSIVLPSSITAIGDNAFSGLRSLEYSTLEIPEGVTKIGVGAFSYNEDYNGVELILPSTLDSIGGSAFNPCGFRCELKLTDNIRYIGRNAFGRTPNFYGTFHIPSKLSSIDDVFESLGSDGSFDGEIEIPQGITSVSGALTVAMSKRVALNLPAGVKKIGRGWPQKGFKSIHFNDDLEEIGEACFLWYAMPPEGIKLPSSLVKIGYRAFAENGLEGEIEIPEGCLDIGAEAFAGANITKLTLPSHLEVINDRSFGSLHYLTQVTIPKYVNYIGERAFSDDDALRTVICLNPEPPTLGKEAFDGLYFDKVVLEVPEQSVEAYRHADGWKDFQNVTAYHELAFNIPEIICLDKGVTREGILRAEGDWEVSECPSWVTVSPSSGSYKDELTVTVKTNNGDTREGRIVFKLKGKSYTTYTTVRQVASAEYKEDATVTLQTASAGVNAIPLFIVGEGYGADDIASGLYLTDMREQMEHLFSIEPYKTYRNYFTVSTAYACSPQSGMSGLTKFSSNNDKVWQYAKTYGTSVDERAAILVLCNTKAYSNHTDLWDNGLSFSWIGKTEDIYPYDQKGDVLHYFGGRGFGKLGPEYVNHFTFMKACGCPGCNMTNEFNWAREKGWWQNVSITSKMTELPWYHLIFHEKYASHVDVYEGAMNHARGTYRSENQSAMGAAHVYYYNTISREEIVKRILTAAGETFTFDKFVASDKMELPKE